MLKKFLITSLVLFALPFAAKAICSWVPATNCQIVGDGWIHATQTDFCNDADGNNNRRAEDRSCCCGPSEDIGCCQSQRFVSFVSNQAKCAEVEGRLFPPYPVFYTSGQVSCIKNEADCYWVLSTTCDSIGSWQDMSGAKCAGKKKLEGETLKCCCGKDVPNPNATATEQPPASTDNANPATVVGSVRSDYKTLTNPLGPTDWTLSNLPTIIGRVIRAVLSIIGAIALLIFVYGGFVWMTAAGNEAKVAQGKNILLWATIAIIIIFLSWILVAFMFQALGV